MEDKETIRSFGALIQRRIEECSENEKKFEWQYNPEELMGMLERGPLPEIYSVIYYLVKSHLKFNQYGCTEFLSTDFGTKIWTMACDWGNLLTPNRNENQNTANIAT